MSQSSPTAPTTSADYIVVGGGTTGCTVAARLQQRLPSASILIIEAGPDPSDNEQVLSAATAHLVRHSDMAWQLDVEPNKNLGNRTAVAQVGKGLSGSAAINSGGWTRGPKADYDYWAKLVDDDGWTYEALLPYFRSIEHDHGEATDKSQHGYEGPLNVVPVKSNWPGRKYPLRGSLESAWKEAGVKYNPDPNNGHPHGLAELIECWVKGKRQLPSQFLDLSKITIMSSTLVSRLNLRDDSGQVVCAGIELENGTLVTARREVILSAGALHSPKLLNLSGIGDPKVLSSHSIPVNVVNEAVGKNLSDHLSIGLTWKLRNPERGLAVGSPLMNDPSYALGGPLDFIEFDQADLNGLDAVANAKNCNEAEKEFLLRPDAVNQETIVLYAPMGERMTGIDAAMDGSHISSISACLTPTSRGFVSLRSADPKDPPLIDVNFNDSETDRYILRGALKKVAYVFLETPSGKSFIEREVVPEGYAAISPTSSDEDIDKRIRDFGYSLDHPMGTCAMGKVVDTQCRVKGVAGLRVIDASIIPIPLAAHIQAAVYALAEKGADLIANDSSAPNQN